MNRYSWDFGNHWAEKTFTSVPVRVQSVVSDPSDLKFLIHAVKKQENTNQFASLLIHVDFSQLIQRECVLKKEDSVNSDFERWTPTKNSSFCSLGDSLWFWRRKEQAVCNIEHSFIPTEKESSPCACTVADFEW
jgi:hypothetical protein